MPPSSAKKTDNWRQGLRTELPRLLREDVEVRGQIIALLSEYLTTREETAAILTELRQMRADFDQRMDELGRRIEEQGRRIEEQGRRIEEQGRRIEEQGRRIEEQGRRIEEHTRRLGSLERTLGAIGARWGMMSEDAFRQGVRALFAEQPDVRVESWRGQDEAGRVFGHPAEIEIDAIVRDGVHVLVEIKSSVSAGDVVMFARKAELYAEKTGQTPRRRLIISPFVDARAIETARRFGIEVHAGSTPPPV